MVTVCRAAAIAIALAALLAVAASGCALLAPRPPASVSQTVDQAVAEIRATPGVAAVTSNLYPYDIKDGGPLPNPGTWNASITVEAEPDASGLPVLADAVEHSIDGVAGSMHVDGRLDLSVGANAVATAIMLPVEGGSARASSAGELVATAEQLAAPGSVPEVSAAVRQLAGFGAGDLETVAVISASKDAEPITTRFLMDASSPSGELLTFLAGMAWLGSRASHPSGSKVFSSRSKPSPREAGGHRSA
ncbi:hypothetical protein ASF79_10790 [Agreia sp. Leaf335]|uniref:hypothetical protein n=1 Tax=Agreia sp. Leaf335 TaxID=1736340 RepID=UPI0006F4EA03|nr:hypothetical protein [Agreia sp. Leaf335]KQR20080.1 hypothetical protein ASF79_10790 [Agreia sp. Leaf335]